MNEVVEAVPEQTVRLRGPAGQAAEACARIVPRADAWRRREALKQLAWWVLLPLAALIPPHIPWVLLVLIVPAMRAWGKFNERATLLSLHGPCPRCGTEQEYRELGRIKPGHRVTCASCRWDLRLEIGARATTAVARVAESPPR